MSSANRYTGYDPFAQMYNESWGPKFCQKGLPLLEKLLLQHLPQEAHILDLCCGTGQIAQQLLTKGYRVTGLDGSEAMLHYARENAPTGQFILGDARLFEFPPTFHAVISTNATFNHVMNLEELKSVFHNVYAALLDNGFFLFDLNMEADYIAILFDS